MFYYGHVHVHVVLQTPNYAKFPWNVHIMQSFHETYHKCSFYQDLSDDMNTFKKIVIKGIFIYVWKPILGPKT